MLYLVDLTIKKKIIRLSPNHFFLFCLLFDDDQYQLCIENSFFDHFYIWLNNGLIHFLFHFRYPMKRILWMFSFLVEITGQNNWIIGSHAFIRRKSRVGSDIVICVKFRTADLHCSSRLSYFFCKHFIS